MCVLFVSYKYDTACSNTKKIVIAEKFTDILVFVIALDFLVEKPPEKFWEFSLGTI